MLQHFHSMETFSHFEIFNYAGSRVVEGHKVNINSEYEMKRDILYFALCSTEATFYFQCQHLTIEL